MMRSDQPKPPAVAIVRQNGLSSASSRASVAVTPMSRQIWWNQVVDGRQQACLHSCEGRSPALVLVQIRRIRFAGTSLRSLATWPKRPSLRLLMMYETMRRWTGRYGAKLHRWTRSHASWCAGCIVGNVLGRKSIFSHGLVWRSRSRSHRVVRVKRTRSIWRRSLAIMYIYHSHSTGINMNLRLYLPPMWTRQVVRLPTVIFCSDFGPK